MNRVECVTICIDCKDCKPERGGSEVQSAVPAMCLFDAHLIERRNFVTGETWREWKGQVECSVKNDVGNCLDYVAKEVAG